MTTQVITDYFNFLTLDVQEILEAMPNEVRCQTLIVLSSPVTGYSA
ncbi:hypothetical protein NDI39_22415 [Microcoleus sp. ZQ-A2]|nr:hypothetical protein [Microcoleus sp. FACHB-1]